MNIFPNCMQGCHRDSGQSKFSRTIQRR